MNEFDIRSDEIIDQKHIALRGSLELKYPRNEARCRNECGGMDLREEGRAPRNHRCFLAYGHKGSFEGQGMCEFSSECTALAGL